MAGTAPEGSFDWLQSLEIFLTPPINSCDSDGTLDGRKLSFPNYNCPARRFLYMRYALV